MQHTHRSLSRYFHFFLLGTVLFAALLTSCACDKAPADVIPSMEDPAPNMPGGQVTEPMMPGLDASVPEVVIPKKLGGDCSKYGERQCIDGLCLHSDVNSRLGGRFGSKPCTDNDRCPASWRCVEVFPGPGNAVCVPPSGWSGAEVGP